MSALDSILGSYSDAINQGAVAEYLGPFFSYYEFRKVTLREFPQKNSDRKMLELKQNKKKINEQTTEKQSKPKQ